LCLVTCYFIYYLHNYYTHYPKEFAGEWQYGYKDAISYAEKNSAKYDKIYLTDSIGRPYVYTLFYTKYSPLFFYNNSKIERDAFGFVKVRGFDKYTFGGLADFKDKDVKKALYIISAGDTLSEKKFIKNILLPNGTPVLKIYED